MSINDYCKDVCFFVISGICDDATEYGPTLRLLKLFTCKNCKKKCMHDYFEVCDLELQRDDDTSICILNSTF
jgi:hypothetical protein